MQALRVRLIASIAALALLVAILVFLMLANRTPRIPAGPAALPGSPTLASAALPSPGAPPVPAATYIPGPTRGRGPANRPPTRIEVPAIGLDAPVVTVGWKVSHIDGVEVMEWQVPDHAAGFHQGSVFPGHPGNTVISGHHNLGTEVFRYLIDLDVGSRVSLYVDDTRYDYVVALKQILPEQDAGAEARRENARWILPTDDERLTLVTCWPYSGNSHRLIVVATPLP